MRKKARAEAILSRLEARYGHPECTLDDREDPWRLLVAAILAAQCTDARVNLVTPGLFAAFPTPADFAKASPSEIEPYISSCGLFRNKAKGIQGAAKRLITAYDGVVPANRADLLSLPGVGRKIANLLLGECFGQPALVVDTHCGRLARHLGLTEETDPLKVERDLMAVVPEARWSDWGHYMVEHGRAICQARAPQCESCPLVDLCPKGRKTQRQAQLKAQRMAKRAEAMLAKQDTQRRTGS